MCREDETKPAPEQGEKENREQTLPSAQAMNILCGEGKVDVEQPELDEKEEIDRVVRDRVTQPARSDQE